MAMKLIYLSAFVECSWVAIIFYLMMSSEVEAYLQFHEFGEK